MARFRILGPVEVVHNGAVLPVGGPRHRRLLAILLLRAGRVVPAGTLTEALWGGDPPPSAPAMLHVRVSELRSALRVTGTQLTNHRGGGYLLRVEPHDVDAERFESLAAAGAAALAAGDPERASAELRAALALWNGPALAEFADEPFARSDATRLAELRLQAVENRITADLELGRYPELTAELEKLVAEHPLRERFWGQHMLALYRAGRRGEALRAYQNARRHIADQLGLDPGDALQRLHHAILTADPALKPAQAAGIGLDGGAGATRRVPAQLPADVPAFTGRTDPLRRLDELLAGHGPGQQHGVRTALLCGTAGAGKTALAVHWGHQNLDAFPDGQLYLNLRGYDPDRPLAVADALASLLAALGVADGDIPLDVDTRAGHYRTALAGRRVLLLLDNASSVEQVRPLLPGSAACAVLVTSRDSMPGLVARDGAHRVDVDLLSHEDAHALLHRLIGRRADAEPDAVRALARRCAHLPLALRVAAELAISQPTTPLSTLVRELADQRQRLDLLDAGGDAHTAVTSVFSWSIRNLPAEAARTFRLLGPHPGADIDAYATAALTRASPAAARRTLDALVRAHLLHRTGPGRYGMHDLLRAYATSLALGEESRSARDEAVERLFDFYVTTATAAMDQLHPTGTHRRPGTAAAPGSHIPAFDGPEQAVAWLDAERQTLVAVTAHAARHGRPRHSVQLSGILFRYLDAGHNLDALTVHEYAREAAEQTGDLAGQAEALNGLAIVHLRLGRYEVATGYLQQSFARFREAGNVLGQARALGNVGIAEQLQGHYRAAARYRERAVHLYRQVGDRSGEARSTNDIGVLEQRIGRYQRAADHHTRALTLFREIGDRNGQAIALNNLGDAEQRLGRYERATDLLRQSLALSRQIGDRTGEGWSLTSLGDVHTRTGDLAGAGEHYRDALAIFREIGDRDGEPWALNGLGEVARATGRPADALTHHTAALAHAVANNAPDQQARAHAGLGYAHAALAGTGQAHHHFEQAVTLYDSLESPEAERIRAQLPSRAV